MATLSVELTANIRRLEAELNKAKKELASLEGVAENTGKRTQQAFSKTSKGVANTTPTLLEFNRVIQDAPFGIQGVANNLTQLTQNFGQLRQSAGGTRAALKLLLSGLSGPAGILFAVSAVTSILVTFGDELISGKNKAEDLKKSVDNLNEAFDSELRLSKAIEDSLELQGMSTAGILNSRKDLIRQQLSGLANLIKEQQSLLEIQKIENQRVDNLELIQGFFGRILNVAKAFATVSFNTVFDGLVEAAEDLLGFEIDRSKFSAASAGDKEKERQLQNELNNLLAQQRELQNDILRINKEQGEQIRSNTKDLASIFAVTSSPTGQRNDPVTQSLNQLGLLLDQQPALLAPKLTNLENQAVDFNNRMAQVFSSETIGNAISQAFNGVGQALANGQNLFSALGAGIIGAFGNFLSSFGQQLIQYGTAALAFSAVSKALSNPLTAAPAAAAAIAIGSALSIAGSALSTLGQKGLGGTGAIGGQGSTPFSGSSSTFSSPGGFGNGTVVFEIEGQKLVGVLQRTLGRNARLGGNVSLS